MIKVLIVDDHEVVRLGLSGLVARSPAYQVVGEAGSVAECLAKVETHRPDVVVLDVRLPDGSGIDACREIIANYPGTRVLMLTSYPDRDAVLASVMAGAAGYLLKQANGTLLLDSIARVARGESLLDPKITAQVLGELRALAASEKPPERYTTAERQPVEREPSLTPQEQRILVEVAEGRTNKEIAEHFALSQGTVRNYVSSILQKLDLRSRAQVAAYVARKERDK
ncbi:MAG: response regulator [Mycobacterium leprae]